MFSTKYLYHDSAALKDSLGLEEGICIVTVRYKPVRMTYLDGLLVVNKAIETLL